MQKKAQETGEGQGKLQPAINKADEQESSTRSLQKNAIQESSQQFEVSLKIKLRALLNQLTLFNILIFHRIIFCLLYLLNFH